MFSLSYALLFLALWFSTATLVYNLAMLWRGRERIRRLMEEVRQMERDFAREQRRADALRDQMLHERS